MVDLVTLSDSDDDEPAIPTNGNSSHPGWVHPNDGLFSNLIKTVKDIFDKSENNKLNADILGLMIHFHSENGSAEFLKSEEFREAILNCQKGLTLENSLQKLTVLVQVMTSKVKPVPEKQLPTPASVNKTRLTRSQNSAKKTIPVVRKGSYSLPDSDDDLQIIDSKSPAKHPNKRRRVTPPASRPLDRTYQTSFGKRPLTKAPISSILKNLPKVPSLAGVGAGGIRDLIPNSSKTAAITNKINNVVHTQIQQSLAELAIQFQSHDALHKTFTLLLHQSRNDASNNMWCNNSVVEVCKRYKEYDLSKTDELMQKLHSLLKLEHFRRNPLMMPISFENEPPVNFNIRFYLRLMLFRNGCEKVLPDSYKNMASLFYQFFAKSTMRQKDIICNTLEELPFSDSPKFSNDENAYGTVLIKCLNDMIEILHNAQNQAESEESDLEILESVPATAEKTPAKVPSTTNKAVATASSSASEAATETPVPTTANPQAHTPSTATTSTPSDIPSTSTASDSSSTSSIPVVTSSGTKDGPSDCAVPGPSSIPISLALDPSATSPAPSSDNSECAGKADVPVTPTDTVIPALPLAKAPLTDLAETSEASPTTSDPPEQPLTELPIVDLTSCHPANEVIHSDAAKESDIADNDVAKEAVDVSLHDFFSQVSDTLSDSQVSETFTESSVIPSPCLNDVQSNSTADDDGASQVENGDFVITSQTDSQVTENGDLVIASQTTEDPDPDIDGISEKQLLGGDDITDTVDQQVLEATNHVERNDDVPTEMELGRDTPEQMDTLRSKSPEQIFSPMDTTEPLEEEVMEMDAHDVTHDDPPVHTMDLGPRSRTQSMELGSTDEATVEETPVTLDLDLEEVIKTNEKGKRRLTLARVPLTPVAEKPAFSQAEENTLNYIFKESKECYLTLKSPKNDDPADQSLVDDLANYDLDAKDDSHDPELEKDEEKDEPLCSQSSITFIREESDDCFITNIKASNVQYVAVDHGKMKKRKRPIQRFSDDEDLFAGYGESSGKDSEKDEEVEKTILKIGASSKKLFAGSIRGLGDLSKVVEKSKEAGESSKQAQTNEGSVVEVDEAVVQTGEGAGDDLSSEEDESIDETSQEYQAKVAEIRKCSKKLGKLSRRIRAVQEADIDLDELDKWNNLFSQEHSLKKKHRKVFQRLQELQGELDDLDYHFEVSVVCGIPPVEQYVQNKINQRQKFPDLADVTRLVERALKRNDITMKENRVKGLCIGIFQEVGTQIQRFRKNEFLLDSGTHLSDKVNPALDPAKQDKELRRKLKKNKENAKEKYQSIQSLFAIKQFEKELRGDDSSSDEEEDKKAGDKDNKSDKGEPGSDVGDLSDKEESDKNESDKEESDKNEESSSEGGVKEVPTICID